MPHTRQGVWANPQNLGGAAAGELYHEVAGTVGHPSRGAAGRLESWAQAYWPGLGGLAWFPSVDAHLSTREMAASKEGGGAAKLR